jgi:1-deoxy-D-xylulose-5-phosphate reductoisomerase
LRAIEAKKNILLANKETLVIAGNIIMDAVKKNNVILLPIDSEHSALLQCLTGEKTSDIDRLIITCSGGPFKNMTKEQFGTVTVKDALAHPTWNMGSKITIDSATLMNKGFEVIEAHHLFGIDYSKIDVIVHPQSIIHSMIEYVDGSIKAQLGISDMRLPIHYALNYPLRKPLNLPKLSFHDVKQFTFEDPNVELFPCLQYAIEAGKTGGTLPSVLNASNEILVNEFLQGKVSFSQIPLILKQVLDSHELILEPTIEQILDSDSWARKQTKEILLSKSYLEGK